MDERKYGNWWHTPEPTGRGAKPLCRRAWRSDNDQYVGLYVYGLDNPHPDRVVERLHLQGAWQAPHPWQVVGITLSDRETQFDPGIISYGIPDNWGAAAVVYALIGGLAGVEDRGVAFDQAKLAPRWAAAGESQARVCVAYPASSGYAAYTYEATGDRLALTCTGSMARTRIEVLLPADHEAASLMVNEQSQPFTTHTVETSRYLCADLSGPGVHRLTVQLRSR
ncbi:MAG: hypothetical protein OHK0039_28540 [Bacteroidia bacterium]